MAESDPKKPKLDEPPFLGPNEALGGLSVGDEAEWERTVLLSHVEAYAEVTGDHNPLHFDKEYAESTVFKSLITHGGIQAGALNALVAQRLPGPGSVFMQQNLKVRRTFMIIVLRSNTRRFTRHKDCCGSSSPLLNCLQPVFLHVLVSKYSAPVRVGDVVKATGKITKVHRSKPICNMDITVTTTGVREEGKPPGKAQREARGANR